MFPDPKMQSDIADMAGTGNAMKPVEKDLANSPTATHMQQSMWSRMMAAGEMGKLGADIGGAPGRVIGAGVGFMAPNLQGQASGFLAYNRLDVAALRAEPAAQPIAARADQPHDDWGRCRSVASGE